MILQFFAIEHPFFWDGLDKRCQSDDAKVGCYHSIQDFECCAYSVFWADQAGDCRLKSRPKMKTISRLDWRREK